MSERMAEDSEVGIWATFWIIGWSNGDVFVSSIFSFRSGIASAGSFAAEDWYPADEDAAGNDYLLDFAVGGHAVDAFRRGFRIWADLSGRGTLYFSEPGVYSAQGGQCTRIR